MGLVKLSRKTDTEPVFDSNGIARTPVLVGEYKPVNFVRTQLKPDSTFVPNLYKFGDKQQLFLFTAGKGYITTPRRAYIINEVGVFIPDFDKEEISIHASADSDVNLEFLHITAEMSDYDKKDMHDSHLTLPRFRKLSECWTYKEFNTAPNIKQLVLIEHRNLGRLSMGATLGYGPTYVGEHIHNELEQWYHVLPGSKLTYIAEGEEHCLVGGDLAYTRHASHHGSKTEPGEKCDYIWFEFCENGYPGGIY